MNNLPTIPGFHVTVGQAYTPGDALKWLQAFGVDTVPTDQKVPTPCSIRIHDWDRDWNRYEMFRAAQEALDLGLEVHVNATVPLSDGVSLDARIFYSEGNSTEKGSGAVSPGGEIQDDAGIRGALFNARNTVSVPVAFHAYGNAGADPKHLRLLRRWHPYRRFTVTELHWGFRGADGNRDQHPELYTAEAGAWCRAMVIEAYEQGMGCSMFLGKDFFEADGMPTPSLLALRGDIDAVPLSAWGLARSRTMGLWMERLFGLTIGGL